MPSPEIPILHSKAEYLKAVMYEGVTILEGTATWCQQCKVIAPEVAKMVGEYPNVRIYSSPLTPSYLFISHILFLIHFPIARGKGMDRQCW
jgi:thiol-disulfide isomerase/thioredoxin